MAGARLGEVRHFALDPDGREAFFKHGLDCARQFANGVDLDGRRRKDGAHKNDPGGPDEEAEIGYTSSPGKGKIGFSLKSK